MTKKIILGISVFLLGFLLGNSVKAADLNGYTAEYECRAGGPNCNVDVATLTAQACQQTITTATSPTGDWSAVNWSNNIICIDKGDHTGRGALTISASGTSGTRKILKGVKSGGALADEPWTVSAANRALIQRVSMEGRSYWVFSRLATSTSSGLRGWNICDTTACNNNIWDGILGEGSGNAASIINFGHVDNANMVVQNSVIRENNFTAGVDSQCIRSSPGHTNLFIVNNEIYNCGDGVLMNNGGLSDAYPGTKIENNDIYLTSDVYCDSDGTPNASGVYSSAENAADFKGGGTSGNPLEFIQNRMWGYRQQSSSCGGSGSLSAEVAIHTHPVDSYVNRYGIVRNNIFMDGTHAISSSNGTPNNWSFIGNIFYDFNGPQTESRYTIEMDHATAFEAYFNTGIKLNGGNSLGYFDTNTSGHDLRCNVFIDGGGHNIAGSTTQKDNNVFYNTTSDGGTSSLGSYTINLRGNSTAYSEGDILRTIATPPADGTAGDFLYKVTVAGTSAGSPPSYTTILGGTTADGTMTVRAIRGPYSFKRKLRTGSETVYIPYANRDTAAPEVGNCPSGFASRTGVGIDDTQP